MPNPHPHPHHLHHAQRRRLFSISPQLQTPTLSLLPEPPSSHHLSPPSPRTPDTEEELQHERLQNANLLNDIAYEREKLNQANRRISALETALRECKASANLDARRNQKLEARLSWLGHEVLAQLERGLGLLVLDSVAGEEVVGELLGVVERARRRMVDGEGVGEAEAEGEILRVV